MRIHRRLLQVLALLLALVLTCLAHEQIALSGVITKRDGDTIELKTAKGKSIFYLNQATLVYRGKVRAADPDIKVGAKVEVDAFGHTDEDIIAMRVRITSPAPQPKRKK